STGHSGAAASPRRAAKPDTESDLPACAEAVDGTVALVGLRGFERGQSCVAEYFGRAGPRGRRSTRRGRADGTVAIMRDVSKEFISIYCWCRRARDIVLWFVGVRPIPF